MADLQLRGFLLNIHPVRERDCYLHLLDPKLGKVSVFAPKLLQTKHPNFGLAQPFQLVELEVGEGRSSFFLQEGSVVTAFPRLLSEIQAQSWARQLASFVQDLCVDPSEAPVCHLLLAHALYALDQGRQPEALVFALARLWLLGRLGFPVEPSCFRPRSGGFDFTAFPDLPGGGRWIWSPGARQALLYTQEVDCPRLFSSQMDLGVERQVLDFSRLYTEFCLEKDYSTSDFLQSLEVADQWAQDLLAGRRQRPKAEEPKEGGEA